MAASSSASFVKSFLLVHVVAISLFYSAYGANQVVIPVSSLLPSTNCETTNGKSSFLKVVHKFGPCFNGKDQALNVTELLLRDKSRVNSIQAKLSVKTDGTSGNLPAGYGIDLGIGNYVVGVGLGTPEKNFVLEFDTGSDLTWTQCLPCVGSCHRQRDPIFDPSASSSYSNVSCTSSTCSIIYGNTPRCFGPTCAYKIQYGDGSITIGFIATETLTLTSTDAVTNFLFGCGEDNRGLFGLSDGILGLGRGAVSIVQQTASFYGRYFSYCLPSSTSSLGHLTFGQTNEPTLSFTPIVTIPRIPSLYGIGIVGISVGGKPLSLPSTLFSNPGAIIDSGTVITRLPPTAYVALRDSFRSGMTSYTMAPPNSLLDTCYDFTGLTTVLIPRIVFSLSGGVDLDLTNGTFFTIKISQVCLAFAPNSADTDFTIYGNVQQRTFEVAYDVAGGRIGFGSNGCS